VTTFSLPRRENTGKIRLGPKIVEIHRKSIHVIRYLSALSRWGWQGKNIPCQDAGREMAGKNSHLSGYRSGQWRKTAFGSYTYTPIGPFPAVPGRECRGTARSPRRRPHRSPLLAPPATLHHPGANHTRQSGRQDGGTAIAAKAVALVLRRSQKIHPQTQSETSQKSCHTGPRVSVVGRPPRISSVRCPCRA
jgi:hypothetical protein